MSSVQSHVAAILHHLFFCRTERGLTTFTKELPLEREGLQKGLQKQLKGLLWSALVSVQLYLEIFGFTAADPVHLRS